VGGHKHCKSLLFIKRFGYIDVVFEQLVRYHQKYVCVASYQLGTSGIFSEKRLPTLRIAAEALHILDEIIPTHIYAISNSGREWHIFMTGALTYEVAKLLIYT
jgi:hypothetical protein